ncbi:MAG: GTP cyclohydrolase I FolE [Limnochordia bacterium]|jgi:GTP cyclohydrolase I
MQVVDKEKIRMAMQLMIEAIGEDPNREGLRDTPRRVADMYEEIFSGLYEDVGQHLEVVFEEGHEELILVKNIPFYSMCEHHFLPFIGEAHVAYIPTEGRVTGLSKLARVVEGMARRPQMQERLTSQIADMMVERLKPRGCCVVIEAEHMCMSMRGIKKPGSLTVTSALRGIFRKDEKTRQEVFHLIMPRS